MERKRTGQINTNVIYPELSYRIMEAAFEVHNELGPGFTEDIYEQAIVKEFEIQGIPYERQKPIKISYKGVDVGTYRLDILVDQKIILELKAVSILTEVHKSQLISYLKATGIELGILLNFSNSKVESVRVANKRT